jgi:Holliday junction resolvase
MSKYASGARFERAIVHYLLEKGAVLVMRGAGSKAYGSIKADIVALVPSAGAYHLIIIQAKHSKENKKKARAEFESQKLADWVALLWLDKHEDWKKKIDEVLP